MQINDERFAAALTLADSLGPQSQMRALRTFRENSAGFGDVREAFTAAIEAEIAAKVAEVEREIVSQAGCASEASACAQREAEQEGEWQPPPQTRIIDGYRVLGLALMAVSAFLTGVGLFAIARMLWWI